MPRSNTTQGAARSNRCNDVTDLTSLPDSVDLLDGMTEGACLAPDGLFSRGSRMVVDASHVQAVDYGGLMLIPVAEVFANPNAVFLGFGEPNVYLTVPRQNGTLGWDKYAATMFWRQKSFVADTKGRVQGGILIELRNLKSTALEEICKAMKAQSGCRSITCARANAKVLDAAGFTSGGKSIGRLVRPMALAEHIWQNGLEYRGEPVDLRVIRTGGRSLTDHFAAVIKKESTSVGRLAKKQLNKFTRREADKAPIIEARPLALANPIIGDTSRSAELRIGRPSRLGAAVAAKIGDHPIFEAAPDKALVDLDSPEFEALNSQLRPYPGKLDLATKAKRYLLFAPGPVRFIRRQLAQEMQSVGTHSGAQLMNMLRVSDDGKPFLYNAIVTNSSLRMARLENRTAKDNRKANWLLAKHVLVAGYDPDVRFAGEAWVEDRPDGRVVHINNNSGTYKPSAAQTRGAAKFITEGLGVPVEVHILGPDGASVHQPDLPG